jgi:hypothetical protein
VYKSAAWMDCNRMGDCFHLGEHKQRERPPIMSKETFFRCDFCGERISGKVWGISETTHCCSTCEDTVGRCIDTISVIMRIAPVRYTENYELLIRDVAHEIS